MAKMLNTFKKILAICISFENSLFKSKQIEVFVFLLFSFFLLSFLFLVLCIFEVFVYQMYTGKVFLPFCRLSFH